MTTSLARSAAMSFASLSAPVGLPIAGAAPPTFDVVKNTGSINAKSLPTDDNLVVNGNFGLDILNGGFDWTYVDRIGVRPLLDPSAFHQGHRSLFLTFEGPGINDAGVSQLIPVHGATTYEFSAFYKSAEFEGAGGPQIVLRDAYTGTPLYASDSLNDSDFWKEVHSKVTVPATTSLLRLAIERFPAGSPIRGKLWLDDFELFPEEENDSSDSSADTANTKSQPSSESREHAGEFRLGNTARTRARR